MSIRESKAYKPIEHNSYGYQNNKVSTTVPQQVNSNNIGANVGYEVAQTATSLLGQIFSGFSASRESAEPVDDSNIISADSPNEEVTPEEAIKELIENFDKLPKDTQTDLIQKYSTIKQVTPNITNERLKERLNNYLKGLEYKKATASFDNGNSAAAFEINGVKDAKDNKEYAQALKDHGAAVIELYDKNGDGALNRTEFNESQQTGCSLTDDEKTGNEIIFRFLDENNDGKIDVTEMSALQWVMSTRKDDKTLSDITAEEYSEVSKDMASLGISVLNELTTEESQEFLNLLKENKRDEAFAMLANNKNIPVEDRTRIDYLVQSYQKGLAGLLN